MLMVVFKQLFLIKFDEYVVFKGGRRKQLKEKANKIVIT